MNEWMMTTLDHVVDLKRGFDLPHHARRPGKFPVLTSGAADGWHDQGPIKGPGLVIGRATNLGQPTWSNINFWPLNTTLYVSDFHGNDPKWVHHLFESLDLTGYDSGSVQPMLNRNYIAKVKVFLPPLGTQRAIAEVLGALDDKIAANSKLVSLLESHMSLEYSAAIAVSGRSRPLDAVAQFHNRRRIPLSASERDARQGDVPYFGASGIFAGVNEAIFDEPLVLVGEDGSVMKDDGTAVIQYIWGPSWVNNHAHVLTGTDITTELLYFAISREQVTMLVTGAVQPKINMGNLKRLQLTIPDGDSLARVEAIVGTESASKRAAVTENRTLAKTRDAFLPQLMSGKLRVRDAEKVVEAVV